MYPKNQASNILYEHLPSRLFINYASDDRETALWLVNKLQENGYIERIWFDRQNIEGGDLWKREIDDGLLRSLAMLSILTPRSADPNRTWVRYEQSQALRLFVPIIPLIFERCELPEQFRQIQYLDFTQDRESAFLSLLSAIQKISLRGGDHLINQMPSARRTFIGRETELTEVYKIIEGDNAVVITSQKVAAVHGMAGIGKTMLAEELIRRIGPRYPGGIIIEHRGESPESAQVVLQRWAQYALGHWPDHEVKPEDVRALLQPHGVLLILLDDIWPLDFDNIRVLLDALPPDATRLITTRFRGGAEAVGCKLYSLGRLTEPDALALLYDRLQGKGPGPSEDQLKQLITLLDGHALSIELAAGRCSHTTDLPALVDRLAEQIQYGVDELSLEIEVSDKETSVAVSLSESLRALQEADRHLNKDFTRRFQALGVIPAGVNFNDSLAAAIWGDKEYDTTATKQALSALYDRAMLDRRQETGYYFIHPLLRGYAFALLQEKEDEFNAARNRYTIKVTRIARIGFERPLDQWLPMEFYLPHIRHVGTDLVERVEGLLGQLELVANYDPVPLPASDDLADEDNATLVDGSNFAAAAYMYIFHRLEIGEVGRRWLQVGLACARSLEMTQKRRMGLFLEELGLWYQNRGEPQTSLYYLEKALPLMREVGERDGEAHTLNNLGSAYVEIGQPKQALEHLEQALLIRREMGDRRDEAIVLHNIGELYRNLGELDRALEFFEQALPIRREVGDRDGEAHTLNNLAATHDDMGKKEQALALYQQALPMFQEIGDRGMEAILLNNIAAMLHDMGKNEEALDLFNQALPIYQEVGNRAMEAVTLNNIARVYRALGQLEQALELLGQALPIMHELGHRSWEAMALNNLAGVYQDLGHVRKALDLLEQALPIMREIEFPTGEALTLYNMGEVYIILGDLVSGTSNIEQAIAVLENHHLPQDARGHTPDEMRSKLIK